RHAIEVEHEARVAQAARFALHQDRRDELRRVPDELLAPRVVAALAGAKRRERLLELPSRASESACLFLRVLVREGVDPSGGPCWYLRRRWPRRWPLS